MGWRSWNAFGANINNATFVAAVDALTAKIYQIEGAKASLADAGYGSVGIDEGWENCSGSDPNHGLRQHDADGFPLVDTHKFPDLKWLVDYGHSKHVKMGWYLNGCACGERRERLLNYQGDIQRLHEYGFDGVKFDGCGAATNMTYYAELMEATGRAYLTENCHWGHCGTDAWYHNPDGSSCPTEKWCPFNTFRTSGDINSHTDSWYANLQTTIKFQDKENPLSVPSCWAYPDMMEVGRIDGGTIEWSRAHFGAWCVVSAPLILGLDVTDQKTLETLVPFITNKEAIAINQQWAGHPGRMVQQFNASAGGLPVQVWIKPQPAGKLAVYIVNPAPSSTPVAAADPLSCYTEEPAASKQDNTCFGQYKTQFPAITSVAGCAAQCLEDDACTQFVWALPIEGGVKCRISETCTKPTGYLAGFDGYMRNKAKAGCGAQPKPPAKPTTVNIEFSTLGLTGTTASVRDVWGRTDLSDAAGATLTATVAPMDSAFLVLTPK